MSVRLLVITSRPFLVKEPATLQPTPLPPIGVMRGELRAALRQAGGPLLVRYLPQATAGAVEEALHDTYDVVHFIGAAAADGQWLLEKDAAGEAELLSLERAAQLLRRGNVRLAVMFAAQAGRAAQTLRDFGIPNVVAVDTAQPIESHAAASFNLFFYGHLTRGRSIREAFEAGVDAARPAPAAYFQLLAGEDIPLTLPLIDQEYDEVAENAVPANIFEAGEALTGREALMAWAVKSLGERQLLTLSGPAGIGKTALGIAVAQWHLERNLFPDGVWLVNAKGISTAARLAEALAPASGVRFESETAWSSLATQFANRRVLWLLDDAEALLQDLTPGAESGLAALRGLLAAAPGLRVLATATDPADELAHPVPELEADEAFDLFLSGAPVEQRGALLTHDRAAAAALCRTLAYHPWAITLAAPLLADRTPGQLLSELQPALEEALDQLSRIRVLLDLSYCRLSARARVVFFYLGLLPGGASERMLAALVGQRFAQPAGDLCRELALRRLARLQRQRYTQPELIRAYAEATRPRRVAAARLRAARQFGALSGAIDKLLRYLLNRRDALQAAGEEYQPLKDVEHDLNTRALAGFDAERVNMLAAVNWAFENEAWGLVRELVDNLNTYLDWRSAWTELLALGQLAIDAARREGHGEGEAVALNNLGMVYQQQGRLAEALAVYAQSLQRFRELDNRLGQSAVLNNLGNVYQLQEEWAKATEAYEQSQALCQGVGELEDEKPTLENLGRLYQLQGLWEKAVVTYERGWYVCYELRDLLGEAQMHEGRAAAYEQLNRWPEVIASYEQSLNLRRSAGDQRGEAQTLDRLGSFYQRQGKRAEAIAAYQQSLQLFRALDDHEGEAQTLEQLAEITETYQLPSAGSTPEHSPRAAGKGRPECG